MGSYTSLENPFVDKTIENHLQTIVAALISRMVPQTIALRGSFGRGEGSVMLRDGKLYFLSDYEIDVATTSPFYRSLFAELSSSMSEQLGVQTGIRWMRPDCLERDRIGPIPTGKAPITISLYEFRYGSRVLYGRDFISQGPRIDPGLIRLESGFQLLLNRMAESLSYMSLDDDYRDTSLVTYHWINKTILACAESLLLLWKQYHYSYRERGRRFAEFAPVRLGFMQDRGMLLSELVNQATEWKLRPGAEIYQDTVCDTWDRIVPLCDAVFRHLSEQGMGIHFRDYQEYPRLFLEKSSASAGAASKVYALPRKMLELYRAAKGRGSLRSVFSKYYASQIVYSVVPLLFLSYCSENLGENLREARMMMSKIGSLEPPSGKLPAEWDYLRMQLFLFWKMYCY